MSYMIAIIGVFVLVNFIYIQSLSEEIQILKKDRDNALRDMEEMERNHARDMGELRHWFEPKKPSDWWKKMIENHHPLSR